MLLSSSFEDDLTTKKQLYKSEIRTEIPNIAADIKKLSLRASSKFIKSGALVRQSTHEKQK